VYFHLLKPLSVPQLPFRIRNSQLYFSYTPCLYTYIYSCHDSFVYCWATVSSFTPLYFSYTPCLYTYIYSCHDSFVYRWAAVSSFTPLLQVVSVTKSVQSLSSTHCCDVSMQSVMCVVWLPKTYISLRFRSFLFLLLPPTNINFNVMVRDARSSPAQPAQRRTSQIEA
jgi:hypothetical protein